MSTMGWENVLPDFTNSACVKLHVRYPRRSVMGSMVCYGNSANYFDHVFNLTRRSCDCGNMKRSAN